MQSIKIFLFDSFHPSIEHTHLCKKLDLTFAATSFISPIILSISRSLSHRSYLKLFGIVYLNISHSIDSHSLLLGFFSPFLFLLSMFWPLWYTTCFRLVPFAELMQFPLFKITCGQTLWSMLISVLRWKAEKRKSQISDHNKPGQTASTTTLDSMHVCAWVDMRLGEKSLQQGGKHTHTNTQIVAHTLANPVRRPSRASECIFFGLIYAAIPCQIQPVPFFLTDLLPSASFQSVGFHRPWAQKNGRTGERGRKKTQLR